MEFVECTGNIREVRHEFSFNIPYNNDNIGDISVSKAGLNRNEAFGDRVCCLSAYVQSRPCINSQLHKDDKTFSRSIMKVVNISGSLRPCIPRSQYLH